jgi:hypothetical protein
MIENKFLTSTILKDDLKLTLQLFSTNTKFQNALHFLKEHEIVADFSKTMFGDYNAWTQHHTPSITSFSIPP